MKSWQFLVAVNFCGLKEYKKVICTCICKCMSVWMCGCGQQSCQTKSDSDLFNTHTHRSRKTAETVAEAPVEVLNRI